MFTADVRAHYVASAFAARTMVPQRSRLIINISFGQRRSTSRMSYTASPFREGGSARIEVYATAIKDNYVYVLAMATDEANFASDITTYAAVSSGFQTTPASNSEHPKR